MDAFISRDSTGGAEAPGPPRHHRFTWKHALTELRGRIDSSLKQDRLHFMLRSFSEIGSFPQLVDSQGLPPSYWEHGFNSDLAHSNQYVRPQHFPPVPGAIHRPHISGLDFDSKGVYLASVTNTGSLAVHDFESLFCHAQGSNIGLVMPLVQLLIHPKLEAVMWNPQNQDEVACVAAYVGKLYCYDISLDTNDPSQVLKTSPRKDEVESTGLLDLAFCKTHEKRVLACGRHGQIYIWDRRISSTPQSVFSSQQYGHLSTVALARDEQVVYAGSTSGHFLAWDFRGGRNSTAFIAPGREYNPPFATWKVTNLLEKIPSLRAQTAIEMSGVQSICLNQSCEQQLGFHLNNGWSGVLDLSLLEVTHISCPPPPWLSDESECRQSGSAQRNASPILRRKPTWLSGNSIYVCPSLSSLHIKFLNFKLGPSSPHHVEDTAGDGASAAHVEVSTSESVMTCAAHPLNDLFVAGTNGASILGFGHQGNTDNQDS